MNIPEIIAYIIVGYFFVTLTVLMMLGWNSDHIDKLVGKKRRNTRVFKGHEVYRKAA